jgi:hypothetical protein
MTTEFDDVKRLMGRVNPIPKEKFAGAAHHPPAQAALLRILRSAHDAPASAPSSLNRRRVLLVAGTAAAAASIAGVTALFSPDQSRITQIPTVAMLRYNLVNKGAQMGGKPPAARPILLNLAEVADRQPALSRPANAKYGYVKFNEWYLNVAVAQGRTSTAVIPSVVEQWTPTSSSDSVRRLERRGEPVLTGYGDQETAAVVTSDTPLSDEVLPAGSLVSPPVEALPLDAGGLRRALLGTKPVPADIPEAYQLIQSVIDLHSERIVSPQLSAALWRMLSDQPQLSYLGSTTDRAGRAGVAIAFEAKVGLPKRWVLIVDPKTGRLNSSEEILTTDPGKLNVTVPAVIGYKLFLRQGWAVDSATAVR